MALNRKNSGEAHTQKKEERRHQDSILSLGCMSKNLQRHCEIGVFVGLLLLQIYYKTEQCALLLVFLTIDSFDQIPLQDSRATPRTPTQFTRLLKILWYKMNAIVRRERKSMFSPLRQQ